MNKKTIIIIAAAVVVFLSVGLAIYLKNKPETGSETPEKTASPAEKLIEGATKGTLPSLSTNPLESKPNLNLIDQTNPFKDIKTNPFK